MSIFLGGFERAEKKAPSSVLCIFLAIFIYLCYSLRSEWFDFDLTLLSRETVHILDKKTRHARQRLWDCMTRKRFESTKRIANLLDSVSLITIIFFIDLIKENKINFCV